MAIHRDPRVPLESLRVQASSCHDCALSGGRSNVVYGDGNPLASLVIVGEAPGAEEDRIGRPFQGKAGSVLDDLLADAGLHRDDVYIANVVMCRPPANRPPKQEWIVACSSHLDDQLRVIEPRVLLALGATSIRRLLGYRALVRDVRARVHVTNYGLVVPSYHPSPLSLNRSPGRRQAIAEDMVLAASLL